MWFWTFTDPATLIGKRFLMDDWKNKRSGNVAKITSMNLLTYDHGPAFGHSSYWCIRGIIEPEAVPFRADFLVHDDGYEFAFIDLSDNGTILMNHPVR
jgi:hypothetical protein